MSSVDERIKSTGKGLKKKDCKCVQMCSLDCQISK